MSVMINYDNVRLLLERQIPSIVLSRNKCCASTMLFVSGIFLKWGSKHASDFAGYGNNGRGGQLGAAAWQGSH